MKIRKIGQRMRQFYLPKNTEPMLFACSPEALCWSLIQKNTLSIESGTTIFSIITVINSRSGE
jgi:hypothetical protein